uniref:Uncharacterized protein n=1 Tax=Graphocephala atropunctata TaxID=36148 RepID=A0A1B6KN20_9HEMI
MMRRKAKYMTQAMSTLRPRLRRCLRVLSAADKTRTGLVTLRRNSELSTALVVSGGLVLLEDSVVVVASRIPLGGVPHVGAERKEGSSVHNMAVPVTVRYILIVVSRHIRSGNNTASHQQVYVEIKVTSLVYKLLT